MIKIGLQLPVALACVRPYPMIPRRDLTTEHAKKRGRRRSFVRSLARSRCCCCWCRPAIRRSGVRSWPLQSQSSRRLGAGCRAGSWHCWSGRPSCSASARSTCGTAAGRRRGKAPASARRRKAAPVPCRARTARCEPAARRRTW